MFESIPPELKELKQWVCIHGDSKVPMKTFAREAASSVEPETWSTFEDACNAVDNGYYDNIGFVFDNNGIVGIDIDTGYDEDGFISPSAADIIGRCQSYTEKSRSGRGFHVLVKGNLPFKGKNNLNGVEIYQDSRYFIMTGDALLYNHLCDNQEAIDHVLQQYFPETMRERESNSTVGRMYIPKWEKPSEGRVRLRPIYPRIPNGCRNICLTSLAGMMHNQGYSRQQIYDELLYCNTVACEPCLDKNEIKTITSSIARYKR